MKQPEPSEPPYLRIVADIREQISRGELVTGQRIPSARQITKDWNVAIATATKALARLRQDGLVRALPGIGTVVAADTDAATATVPRTPRRRRPAGQDQEMNLDRLIAAATIIADAEGVTALSMRRVASELDVPTMSLYQYVSSKEELIQMMVEAAIGEVSFPDPPPPDWRSRLELAARLQWAVYRRHPWLAQLMSLTRPTINSGTLAQAEWILGALDGLGLSANAMLHIQVTLVNYVRGTAVNLEQETQFEQDTGMTDEQWLDSEGAEAAVAMVLSASPMPRFAKMFGQQGIHFNLDTLFDFGLGRLIDGIGVLIEDLRSRAAAR